MPKVISTDELNKIQNLISNRPSGLSIAEIEAELNPDVTRRTLQRQLNLLSSRNEIDIRGKGKSTRYFSGGYTTMLNPYGMIPLFKESGPTYSSHELVLSAKAKAIQETVRQPLHLRKIVGYDREFLDNYEPNKTFYLTSEIRQRLLEVNQTRQENLPAGTHARKVYSRLIIDLSWNSSRLEGNTYSLLETDRLLSQGEVADGKALSETQMILNHKQAIDMLVEGAEEAEFNHYTILNLHAALLEELLNERDNEGRLRSMPVDIGGSSYRPCDVPQLIEECFEDIILKGSQITDPFEQAFFAMVHIPYLQPFVDGNKRTSRFVANIPLIKGNFCPLSFVGLPDRLYVDGLLAVYELNRVDILREVFAWIYEQSCARYSMVRETVGEPDPVFVRHRILLKSLVTEVVKGKMDKATASSYIRRELAREVSQRDQVKAMEIVESNLLGLHEGCIVRYRLRPSEFQEWRKTWQ